MGDVRRGFGVSAALSPDVVGEVAREAERLGYASFWVNDLPHADGLGALAAAAGVTTRIELGVGVVPLDQRPPDAIVGRVESLGLPRDRLVLGVGSGDSDRPLALVGDGVGRLREEIATRVVVGALGPKMAELGGAMADGVLLNWLTPQHAERASRWVLDAAAAADRLRPSLLAYVRCGLLPHAEQRLQAELARYEGITSFERHLERMDAAAEDSCVLGHDGETLQAGIARYDAVLDQTIVRAVTPDDELASLLPLLHACAP